jgi:hypothetical protein
VALRANHGGMISESCDDLRAMASTTDTGDVLRVYSCWLRGEGVHLRPPPDLSAPKLNGYYTSITTNRAPDFFLFCLKKKIQSDSQLGLF